ncbi:MAG: rod shape-determining protein MreD [Patescibacteria group bacterium]
MSKFNFIILLIILAVAQTIFATSFSFYGAVPNLFILALVWLSIHHTGRPSWFLAAAGGIFLDLYSGTFFGLHLITLLILCSALKMALDSFLPREENPFLMAGLLVVSTAGYQIVFFLANLFLVYWNLVDYLEFRRFFGAKLIWQILYSLIIFYPVSLLAKKLLPRKS